VRAGGHTLLETTLALAILGLLASLGVASASLATPAFGILAVEARGALDQAFLLARARGGDVRVALGGTGGEVAPLVLPRGVRWGLAPGTPLPPHMDPPVKAHLTGQAHPLVTVTPRGTATASAWFLTDGRDALCLRLSGQGHCQVLRWRAARRAWIRI
jgi:type II secretory pathway pseudopilin PulG